MIAIYSTTTTAGFDAAQGAHNHACGLAGASSNETWYWLTPNSTDLSPLTPGDAPLGTSRNSERSLLVSIPENTLDGAVLAPGGHQFPTAYSITLISLLNNAVMPGGWICLPFFPDKKARKLGYWTLGWLKKLLGRPRRVDKTGGCALFRKKTHLTPPPSVLEWFSRDLGMCSVEFLQHVRDGLEQDFLDRCQPILLQENRNTSFPLFAEHSAMSTAQLASRWTASATYFVTGTSYKTAGLRRIISRFMPDKSDLRLVDFGGGMGMVGAELLLGEPQMGAAHTVEPCGDMLPGALRLHDWHARRLKGRFKLAWCRAEDFEFKQHYDLISLFASLLFFDKNTLRSTMQRLWDNLAPGGCLVVHEHIKRETFQDMPYYDKMFTEPELHDLLSAFGTVHTFRSSDFAPLRREDAGELLVFRVVQKD